MVHGLKIFLKKCHIHRLQRLVRLVVSNRTATKPLPEVQCVVIQFNKIIVSLMKIITNGKKEGHF